MCYARMAGAIFFALGLLQLIDAILFPPVSGLYDALLANLDNESYRVIIAVVFMAIGWYLVTRKLVICEMRYGA